MFTCCATQIHTESLLKRLRAILWLSDGERESWEREKQTEWDKEYAEFAVSF